MAEAALAVPATDPDDRDPGIGVDPKHGLMVGRGVTVVYGKVVAVDAVDFHVDPLEILAIIGPNGAGKTTLFNVMSGAARLSAGSLHFDGIPIAGLPSERRAALGIARTFQNLLLLSELTVLENVALGATVYRRSSFLEVLVGLPRSRADDRLARDIARQALRWVGLDDRRDFKVGSLPYADRRRVELARALTTGPRLVLVDEPAAGMTTAESLDIAAALVRARDELGITVIVVEHDMSFVRAAADRVMVMNLGSVLAEGAPAEVLTRADVAEAYLGTRHDPAGEEGS